MSHLNQIFKIEMVLSQQKHKNETFLKKRSNQWENEVPKSIPEPPVRPRFLSYGDRFIPRRYSQPSMEANIKYATKTVITDVLNMRFTQSYWRQHNYTLALNNSLQLEEAPILRLSDVAYGDSGGRCGISEQRRSSKLSASDWACKPRPKPLAFPEATHDSPGFGRVFDPNMVDWSVNEQIVAAFRKRVIIWKRADDVTMLFKVKNVCSLAYSSDGKFLAIGCKAFDYPVLELWDVSRHSTLLVVNGKVFSEKHLRVQCIAWNPSASQIICGTGSGTIFVLSVPSLKILREVTKHKLPICAVKLSPTMRYLASGDLGGNIVVYNWNSCDVYIVVQSRRKLSTTFDWHPWNGVDLVISENTPASIVILHVPSKEIVAYYQRKDKAIIINSVTFSKITGELVVSMSKTDNSGHTIDSQIAVMSSLNRVVDLLRVPEVGVRFVMWSPDGTKLATAGNDETLTIWNFLPENKERLLRKDDAWKSNNILPEFQLWSSIK